MEKRIVIKVAGAGEPRDIVLRPGVTTKDVLDNLGLGRNMMLTQDAAGEPFAADENLWAKLEDGQKIYCAPTMEVGQ